MYGRVEGLVFQLQGSWVWFEGLRDVELGVQVAGAYQRVMQLEWFQGWGL